MSRPFCGLGMRPLTLHITLHKKKRAAPQRGLLAIVIASLCLAEARDARRID